MKKTCRKYWNAEIAGRIARVEGVVFDNPQFSFETQFTSEDYAERLVDRFGVPRERVDAFWRHLRAMDFFSDDGETIGQLFERFFPGRDDVHRLLLEPISYANGSSLDDPAIAYGIVFSNFMREGIWTFRGSTDELVKLMRDELSRNDVELFANAQVDAIVVEDGAVRGVRVGGRFLAARAVVSNANLKTTVERLAGPSAFDQGFLARCRAVRLNNASCQVYMGLAHGAEVPFVGEILFTSTRERFESDALCDFFGESRAFSFYYPRHRRTGQCAIVSSTNARFADWAALDDAAYAAAKERLVAETVEHLEHYVPGIAAKIDHLEASTPRTFAFYTQHPQGTSFGTKFEGLQVSFDLPAVVRGLYHAGSVGIIMSGWLGAANYGAIVANRVDALLREDRAAVAGRSGSAR
jgi:phytoene dehydrogenase-like protein